jgi:tight adherence protein B
VVAVTGDNALAALFGIGVAAGILLVIRGLLGVPAGSGPSKLAARWEKLRTGPMLIRVGYTSAAGIAALAFTGWVAGGILGALGAWVLPRFLGTDRAHVNELARIEAVAVYTELLRDTLSAAAGLEQSLIAAAPASPPAIRAQASELAARISSGMRLPEALRLFAIEVGDATCDLVVAALTLAAANSSRNLADLLGTLAQAARDQASLRLRTAADRARTRTTVRAITITILGMVAGLTIFARSYLAPYGTPLGQVVLLVVAGVFALSFVWLARIARGPAPVRFLTRTHHEEQL